MRPTGRSAIVVVALLQAGLVTAGDPPAIQLESPRCARRAARPLVCARVVDDGTIIRVRVLFRAKGTGPFYWTEMRFEGSRYCAWLPVPTEATRSIEYYAEAVDSDYELSRTREEKLPIEKSCPVERKAPDERICVGTTVAGQSPEPTGFETDALADGC